jgi:hypothetical protein
METLGQETQTAAVFEFIVLAAPLIAATQETIAAHRVYQKR